MDFKFNLEKNAQLLKERGVGFADIIVAFNNGNMLDDKKHHNKKEYPNQRIMYVRISDEVYAVPYVMADGDIFLKTLFPSRKARKRLLKI